MKKFAVSPLGTMLGTMMVWTALLGAASAALVPNTAALTSFSSEMNFMSQAGYTRCLNHLQTGQRTACVP